MTRIIETSSWLPIVELACISFEVHMFLLAELLEQIHEEEVQLKYKMIYASFCQERQALGLYQNFEK